MRFPNLQKEKHLWQQGFQFIAGVDEVGKGAWAGPVVAAAVILKPAARINGVRDSKLLSAGQRENLYKKIIASSLAFGVGLIGHEEIDRLGIMPATLAAMREALLKLACQPDYLLLDAFSLNYQNLPNLAVIDGDYKVTSIAAASIIAKVTRDKIMQELGWYFPEYGFAEHKGYGTKKHYQMICQNGACAIHRQSFAPLKSLLNKE